MSETTDNGAVAAPHTLVWDWPLRLWHWAFALCIGGSLGTGLAGDVALMDWHLRLGYAALALLLFRVGWGIWGGRYARFATFRTSPARFLAHFRGERTAPRTAPGAALAALLILAVAVQAVTGLYTTDDIFTEGPLVRHASGDTVALMSFIHRRAFWVVLALVGVHLLAQAIYALLRDPTPLGMFTGRKPVSATPAAHLWIRALLTAAAAAAAVWWGLLA